MFFEKVANKLFAILSEEGNQEEFNLYIGIFFMLLSSYAFDGSDACEK